MATNKTFAIEIPEQLMTVVVHSTQYAAILSSTQLIVYHALLCAVGFGRVLGTQVFSIIIFGTADALFGQCGSVKRIQMLRFLV